MLACWMWSSAELCRAIRLSLAQRMLQAQMSTDLEATSKPRKVLVQLHVAELPGKL